MQVQQLREQLEEKFRAQAELLQKLEQELKELRAEHKRFGSLDRPHLEPTEKPELPSALAPADAALAAVRNLLTANLPKQVFNKLTEEACRLGVRAVAFEVRNKAAWGASAHGFGPQLTEQALRSLAVPLSVDTPFRQVFELGQHYAGNSESLEKNANVLNRLNPDSDDSILLLPIRSGGGVDAILYVDSGRRGAVICKATLELLAEFAGAHLDRLKAVSGRATATVTQAAYGGGEAESMYGQALTAGVAELSAKAAEPIEVSASRGETRAPGVSKPAPLQPALPLSGAGAPVDLPSAKAQVESSGARTKAGLASPPVLVRDARRAVDVPPAAAPGASFDVSQLSEAEKRAHKDARRFARLLVADIELYNKAKLAEGRKNKDLYMRMKLDIDRSRQTFEKRFGQTVGKQFDYFHDELVRTLADNDPSLLGSGYPGPSV